MSANYASSLSDRLTALASPFLYTWVILIDGLWFRPIVFSQTSDSNSRAQLRLYDSCLWCKPQLVISDSVGSVVMGRVRDILRINALPNEPAIVQNASIALVDGCLNIHYPEENPKHWWHVPIKNIEAV